MIIASIMQIPPLFLLLLVAFFGMLCLIILGLAVFAFFFFKRFFNSQSATFTKRQEIEEVFRGFAQMHNLVFDQGSAFAYPNLSGIYRNRPVTISLARPVAPPPQSHTVAFTPVKAALAINLEVAERDRYYHQSGVPEFTSGSQSFDDKFQLRGSSPDWTRILLTQTAQNTILESGMSLLRLSKGRLAVYVRGFETHPQALESLLNLACTLAEFIDQGVV